MRYISTTGKYTTDLRGAITNCFSADGSLYLPERISPIPRALFNNVEEMSLKEISYIVAAQLFGEDIDHAILKRVVDESFVYNVPFVSYDSKTEIMELFHGPTGAFKDFSAQFTANFVKDAAPKTIPRVAIMATTGNTGEAIAHAFAGDEGRHVVVLYPKGVVTASQIERFNALGPKVHCIEVAGDIAKCKAIVRQAMADESLSGRIRLVCMNTANFVRIVPQVVLFFYAYAHLKATHRKASDFSPVIPCGNLSSLVSAVIAKRLGLPIGKIVAGCSANDGLVKVLSGELSPAEINRSSHTTLARAMDSGYPTNLGRILKLYDDDIKRACNDIAAYSLSDDEIRATIRSTAERGYLADPHTAVAIGTLEKARADGLKSLSVVLATAHPSKSEKAVRGILAGDDVSASRHHSPHSSAIHNLPPSYSALKRYLTTKVIR